MMADSRYRNSYESVDPDGYHYLAEYEPYGFEDLTDSTTYEVREGDHWQGIAGAKFAPLARAHRLFFVIMDFQPDPPLDPSVPPEPGTVIVVPSRHTARTKALASDRRRLA